MKVFLIGYMGSGKTTVGKKLSKKMNIPFYDLDEEIEKKTSLKITEIFEVSGETEFRILEKEMLHQFFTKDNFILACGGGTPIFFDNMLSMNKYGITVYLEMSTNAALSRLKNEKETRPLLKNKTEKELLTFIENHLKERILFYEKSKIKVKSINADLNEIVRLIKHEL